MGFRADRCALLGGGLPGVSPGSHAATGFGAPSRTTARLVWKVCRLMFVQTHQDSPRCLPLGRKMLIALETAENLVADVELSPLGVSITRSLALGLVRAMPRFLPFPNRAS